MFVIPFIVWPTPFIREPDNRTVAAGASLNEEQKRLLRAPTCNRRLDLLVDDISEPTYMTEGHS